MARGRSLSVRHRLPARRCSSTLRPVTRTSPALIASLSCARVASRTSSRTLMPAAILSSLTQCVCAATVRFSCHNSPLFFCASFPWAPQSGFSTALVDKAAAAELRADAVESSALSTKADMAALQALLADVTADAAGLRLEIRALTADNDRSLVTIGSLQGRLTGLQLQLDDTSVAAAPAVAAGLAAQAAPNRALLDCEQVITRLRGDLAAALRARAEQAKLASEVRACLGAVEAQYEDLRVDAAATLHEKVGRRTRMTRMRVHCIPAPPCASLQDATIARLEATLLAALAAHVRMRGAPRATPLSALQPPSLCRPAEGGGRAAVGLSRGQGGLQARAAARSADVPNAPSLQGEAVASLTGLVSEATAAKVCRCPVY